MEKDVLNTIITDEDGAETLVKEAEKLGGDFARNKMSTSQIRAIFSEVRQIQAMWSIDGNRKKALRRFILLKPKMAYRGKKTKVVKPLVEILTPAADLVIAEKDPEKQDANFQRFVEFFEAILAYHKAAGAS